MSKWEPINLLLQLSNSLLKFYIVKNINDFYSHLSPNWLIITVELLLFAILK